MLETVSKGLKAARNRLKGRTEITPEVVDEALRDIRVSLLEADVSFEVVKRFVARVREKAIGEVVETKVKTGRGVVRVTPQDHFVKICHDELEALMGPVDTSRSEVSTGPMRASSSSWQILTKWSCGVTRTTPRPVFTFVSTTSPIAFSRTRATNRFTTSKETSASRRDTRMSRRASSTTSGVISVRPFSLLRAALKPLETVSSMR